MLGRRGCAVHALVKTIGIEGDRLFVAVHWGQPDVTRFVTIEHVATISSRLGTSAFDIREQSYLDCGNREPDSVCSLCLAFTCQGPDCCSEASVLNNAYLLGAWLVDCFIDSIFGCTVNKNKEQERKDWKGTRTGNLTILAGRIFSKLYKLSENHSQKLEFQMLSHITKRVPEVKLHLFCLHSFAFRKKCKTMNFNLFREGSLVMGDPLLGHNRSTSFHSAESWNCSSANRYCRLMLLSGGWCLTKSACHMTQLDRFGWWTWLGSNDVERWCLLRGQVRFTSSSSLSWWCYRKSCGLVSFISFKGACMLGWVLWIVPWEAHQSTVGAI